LLVVCYKFLSNISIVSDADEIIQVIVKFHNNEIRKLHTSDTELSG